VTAAIALIRVRFGYFAIGLGEAGIRYRCGEFVTAGEYSSQQSRELLAH
jgi:hypothetical protein